MLRRASGLPAFFSKFHYEKSLHWMQSYISVTSCNCTAWMLYFEPSEPFRQLCGQGFPDSSSTSSLLEASRQAEAISREVGGAPSSQPFGSPQKRLSASATHTYLDFPKTQHFHGRQYSSFLVYLLRFYFASTMKLSAYITQFHRVSSDTARSS